VFSSLCLWGRKGGRKILKSSDEVNVTTKLHNYLIIKYLFLLNIYLLGLLNGRLKDDNLLQFSFKERERQIFLSFLYGVEKDY